MSYVDYIVNEKKCLSELSKALLRFKNFHTKELFFLMGVYNHFFVLKLNDLSSNELKLEFIDSVNTPINDIMNGVCSVPNPTAEDQKRINNMKTAIETVLELYYADTSVQSLLVRLRAKETLDSYYKFKARGELLKWLHEEYPPQGP